MQVENILGGVLTLLRRRAHLHVEHVIIIKKAKVTN
jgi:hypothetical protein